MTVVRRGEMWGAKVWDRGTKKYRWLGTFDTEEAARKAVEQATPEYHGISPKVHWWGRIWLSDYARPSAGTRLVYRQAVDRITRDLGQFWMDEVDRLRARQLAQEWPRNISAVARTMWNDAVRDGIASRNPFAEMRLPQSRGRKDIVALTEAQILELADVAAEAGTVLEPERRFSLMARAIVLTLAYTGIRPGELMALRWEDVNLTDREIGVRRTRDVTGVEKPPKNGKPRLVTIPPVAVDALRQLMRRPDDYVFYSLTGKPLTRGSLHYFWRPIMAVWQARGNPYLEVYELRHACATLLLERGLSAEDVAIQLGHQDGGSLVRERYGHPSEDRARDRLKMAFSDDEPARSQYGADPQERAS